MAMYYRKKPVVVEAVLLDGSHKSIKKCLGFMGQKVSNDVQTQRHFYDYVGIVNDKGMNINTLEGVMTASVGDYIIKGVNGEFYPCKPDIFEKTYEEV